MIEHIWGERAARRILKHVRHPRVFAICLSVLAIAFALYVGHTGGTFERWAVLLGS